tara:strand:+ start:508 stop:2703 length:2196 start_codon:yes stop_codon:yes gene_type:complete
VIILAEGLDKLNRRVKDTETQIRSLSSEMTQLMAVSTQMLNQTTGLFETFSKSMNLMNKTMDEQNAIASSMERQRLAQQKDMISLTDKVEGLATAFSNTTDISQKFERIQKTMTTQLSNANRKLTQSLNDVNLAIQQQVNTANSSDAAKVLEGQRERAEQLENLKNKYEKFIKVEKEGNNELSTRQRIMSDTINQVKKETGQAKLPFFEGLSTYLEKGGTSAEYLAQFLTSTREELKIFGVEVASVRRFLYGFMPPGTFRLINKFATTLNFVGGTIRSVKADAENAGNVITRMLFASTVDKKGVKRLTARKREVSRSKFDAETELTDLRRKDKSQMTKIEAEDFEKQEEYLVEFIQKQTDEEDKIAEKLERVEKSVGGRLQTAGETILGGILGIGEQVINHPKALGRFAATQKVVDGISVGIEKSLDFAAGTMALLDDLEENGGRIGKGFAKFVKFIGRVTKFLLMATMYLILFSVAFFIIKKFVQENKDKFQKVADVFIPMLSQQIAGVWEGAQLMLSGVMDFISAVFTQDVDMILESAKTILSGLWSVIWNAIKIFGTILLGLVSAPIYAIAMNIWEFFTDFGNDTMGKLETLIGLIIGVALTLAILATLPVQLPLIVVGAIALAGGFLVSKLIDAINPFAEGGITKDGLSLVGEKGPELIRLPKGTRVHSNKESKEMLNGGSNSVVNNFNITVNAKDSSKAEMRRMADEIGRMINSKINRSTSSSTLR